MERSLSKFSLESSGSFLKVIVPIRYHSIEIAVRILALAIWGLLVFKSIPAPFDTTLATSASSFCISVWPTLLGVLVLVDTIRGSIGMRETILIDNHSITISLPVLLLGRRVYHADMIRNLRVAPSDYSRLRLWPGHLITLGRLDGSVCFDYESRITRFGHMLNETEAGRLVAAIQQRFPQYAETVL
jgi:hypothetical protein